MAAKKRLLLAGATGLEGESLLSVLGERGGSALELVLLESEEYAGGRVRACGKEHRVLSLEQFPFQKGDILLFLTQPEIAARYAPQASAAGAFVVDGSGHYRCDSSVPLVMAGMNDSLLAGLEPGAIVALPDAAAVQLVTLLAPLQRLSLRRVDLTLMLAVSAAGKAGVDELSGEAVRLFNMRDIEPKLFPGQVVFNILPRVGTLDEAGDSDYELALAEQCRTLLGERALGINVSAQWVPVFYGHSMVLHLECGAESSAVQVSALLGERADIELVETPDAVGDAVQKPLVYVGRIRADRSLPGGINLFSVADNVKFGIAESALRVAEILEKSHI
jgi:aspartate-semialdehyde dehydrogenase